MTPIKALLLVLIFLALNQNLSQASSREVWKDQDKAGFKEKHLFLDGKGKLLQKTKDTNADGKPDEYSSYPQGSRNFVLKELDRNFDGKIDKRSLSQWDPNKGISIWDGKRIIKTPVPGYSPIWKEGDNDFDGIIDTYHEKKQKNETAAPPKNKVGQAIDIRPMTVSAQDGVEKTAKEAGPQPSQEQERIDQLNQKMGLKS